MKKFLAGLLAMTMAMSMMSMTAFADTTTGGESIVGKDNVQTTDETIDTTLEGSLTLYKYESTNAITGDPGTGLGGQTIPDGATAIDGVGFTLYKVADLGDTNYYTEDGIALPTGTPSVTDIAGWTKVTDTETDANGQKLTDANGQVAWTGLDLGIYYVVESKKPVSAISQAVNFYVAIPMTTVDGTSWLYDVVVYPKNQTTYAGVTLKKIGNDDTATTIDGAKFVLQKLDTSNNTWYYVTNTGTDNADNAIWAYTETDITKAASFTTANGGTISLSGLSFGQYRFIETYAPDGYIMDGTIYHTFEIQQDGKVTELDNDYDGDGTTEDSTTASGSDEITAIIVNNEKPDVDKQVKKEGGTWVGDDSTATSNNTGEADYSIGDYVPFRIVVDIPSNINKLKTFTVTDTMSAGLTDAKNFVIKGYTSDEDIDTADDGTEITSVSATQDTTANTWTVDFSTIKDAIATAKYEKIVIEFEAKLDTDAVIAGTGNPNDVKLTYSNQITADQDTTDPSTSELTDRVVVYAFRIKLTKTFTGAADGTDYVAKFQLYRKALDATTSLTVNGTEVDVIAVGSEVTLTGAGTTAAVHDFDGLENGTYYLVETSTAPGYNLLQEPVEVVINEVYETTITTTSTTGADGQVTETTTSTTKYYNVDDDGNKTTEITDAATDATATDVTQTIVNSKGFTLPTTGGVGTYIFVFVGVSMMAAAVILFFTTKKKEAQ